MGFTRSILLNKQEELLKLFEPTKKERFLIKKSTLTIK
jgi:hypothetical protein